MQIFQNLSNKLLISTPVLNNDKYFAKAIVYILINDQVTGSLGLIVNSIEQNATVDYSTPNLDETFKTDESEYQFHDNIDYHPFQQTEQKKYKVTVRIGGPCSNSLLLLHTNDHLPPSSLLQTQSAKLSYNREITHHLEAPSLSKINVLYHFIKDNKWPSHYFAISGFSIWALGQLENEIKNNYWVLQDFCMDTVFGKGTREQRWEEAITKNFNYHDKVLLTTNFLA
ncbi:YqgE/AlgH family transcriptional regulator [Rickettsiales endosymbiont of Paramecium tredecaurelia]|uniref:YqgE/AlgH family protein n=1 Tax=Candidatus Sarmatiella mevalonica TaxID=2770581 RepID=UPI001923B0CA|nr:YqgE/AlgH family protein [Candidatus Sarmatiella mevalonica]MBL3284661.1 YqgE/AlgH family transcriptional regulator [Candidatus Sarmatiella mevalonica]